MTESGTAAGSRLSAPEHRTLRVGVAARAGAEGAAPTSPRPPAHAFPPFSPSAATRPPTFSWEVVGRLRAHCLIPCRRVPRSPKCVAVCVTDGASGACEGIRVHLLLKGAFMLVPSSLDYCEEERGVRGSVPTPGRLCSGLSSSETPDAPCPRPARGPRAPGSPAASPQALWAGSALRVSLSPSKTQVD